MSSETAQESRCARDRGDFSRREVDNIGELDEAATGAGVTSVFQPIVALQTREPVGFEALSRWPSKPRINPQDVFAHASATGRVSQLDRMCIDLAVDTALKAGLSEGALLCVNSEPASVYAGTGDSQPLALGREQFELVFELTERDLLANLPTLLSKVEALRADGIAVALDDVGTHPDSIALLDVVRPAVIKLATTLVQAAPDAETARIESAVTAHRERTGALIIAEGIETDRHLEHARTLGADLGQGYLFGAPGPLPPRARTVAWSPPAVANGCRTTFRNPFDVVAADPSIRTARTDTLLAMSRHIEEQALRAGDAPMVMTALQHDRTFSGSIRDRYDALAKVSSMVAVLGRDLTADLPGGVRRVSLDASDPLCAQWVVIALGPHTAEALIARERGAPAADEGRRFDFLLTHDRTVITAAARTLLNRVS